MASPNEELCYTPAVELAEMIRAKQLSPVEVADAFLERLEAVNSALNAFVTTHEDVTRGRAKEAEAAVMRGDALGPLHGVPISLKDANATKGIRTTSGSRVLEDYVPDYDAPLVKRLNDAGAVSLGKTNLPEFGWLATTDNALFGKTNNPWNTDYTPSGSSGGAASACAAGLGPIAMGSDGGGSIRHPASFCGLFGIKTTFGLIPRDPTVAGWRTLSHNGPLTRTVADAALALDVLVDHEPTDTSSFAIPKQDFLKNLQRDIKGTRVAYSTDLGHAEVEPQVKERFEEGLKAFEDLGCELVESDINLEDARKIFQMTMFVEIVAGELQYIREDGTSDLDPDLHRFVTKRKDIAAQEYMAAQARRDAMYRRVLGVFEDCDLLLTPTMAIPPFKHPRTMAEYPRHVNGIDVSTSGWHPFTFPFNLTHQPAATVPCGFDRDGLPIGLQIVGRKSEDLRVMQAAAQYEQACPWAHLKPSL